MSRNRIALPLCLLSGTVLTQLFSGCGKPASVSVNSTTPEAVSVAAPSTVASTKAARIWEDTANEDVISLGFRSEASLKVFRWENGIPEGWIKFDSEKERVDLGKLISEMVEALKRNDLIESPKSISGLLLVKTLKRGDKSINSSTVSESDESRNDESNWSEVEVYCQVTHHGKKNERTMINSVSHVAKGRNKEHSFDMVSKVGSELLQIQHSDNDDGSDATPWIELRLQPKVVFE